MTSAFIIALVGYFILAIVAVIDKFIVTSTFSRPSTYAFYSNIFFFGAFLLLPFSEKISPEFFLWALVSGLTLGFGTWAGCEALAKGEATHTVPLIGASTAIFTYVLSTTFLGESFSPAQAAGLLILIFASLLFSHTKNSAKFFREGSTVAIVSGLLFAISNVSAKYFYDYNSFIAGLTWTRGLAGLVALIILFIPAARRSLFAKKENSSENSSKSKNPFLLVSVDKFLVIFGTLAIQYAIASGDVAIVSALVGFQYVVVLIIAYSLSKFIPKIFHEDLSKEVLGAEIVAIALAVLGIFLLI